MVDALDYILLIGILLVSLGIGIYNARSGGQQNTRAEFLLNNRQLQVLPTVLSLMVSFQSAISVIYSPAEYYQWGTQMWFFCELVQPFGALISERIIVPMIYKLKITSSYEYLELRFKSRIIRKEASIIGLVADIMYMGVTVIASSLAAEALIGIPLPWGVIIIVGCCAVYTSLGGLRAVVWTGVVQCVVTFTGLLFMFGVACYEVGGIGEVFTIGKDHGRFVTNLSLNPQSRITVWGCILNGLTQGIIMYCFSQGAIQRYSSVKTSDQARRTMLLVFPTTIIYMCICYFVAAGIFAYFSSQHCDPFERDLIESPNQLLPYFVETAIGKVIGGRGLVLAAIYCASLSTLSTYLSGCSAILWEDHFQPFFTNISEERSAIITKLLVIAIAFIVAVFALLVAHIPSNPSQMALTLSGSAKGALVGVFLVAAFSRTVEWRGTCAGLIIGFVFSSWIAIGSFYVQVPGNEPLPSLETDGCDDFTGQTFFDYGYILSFISMNGNKTAVSQGATSTKSVIIPENTIHGIDNLYAISFIYFISIGAGTTCLVSIIVSAILCGIIKFDKPPVSEEHVVSFKNCLRCPGQEAKMGEDETIEIVSSECEAI